MILLHLFANLPFCCQFYLCFCLVSLSLIVEINSSDRINLKFVGGMCHDPVCVLLLFSRGLLPRVVSTRESLCFWLSYSVRRVFEVAEYTVAPESGLLVVCPAVR